MRRLIRLLAIIIAGFIAVSAIPGGFALLLGYEDFPPEWLYDSPFKTYKAPGLILALLPGFSAATSALLFLIKNKYDRLIGIISGFLMAGYISVEVTVLNDDIAAPTGIESFYFLLGVTLAFLSLSLYWVDKRRR